MGTNSFTCSFIHSSFLLARCHWALTLQEAQQGRERRDCLLSQVPGEETLWLEANEANDCPPCSSFRPMQVARQHESSIQLLYSLIPIFQCVLPSSSSSWNKSNEENPQCLKINEIQTSAYWIPKTTELLCQNETDKAATLPRNPACCWRSVTNYSICVTLSKALSHSEP